MEKETSLIHMMHIVELTIIALHNDMWLDQMLDSITDAGGTYHCECGIRLA